MNLSVLPGNFNNVNYILGGSSIPYASASSGGLISVESQVLPGPKLFTDSVFINNIEANSITVQTYNLPALPPNSVLLTDSQSNLIGGPVDLSSQVSHVLPVSSGGTNSGTTLVGSKLMVSNSTQHIIEGPSSTDPLFNSLMCNTLIQTQNLSASGTITFSNLTPSSIVFTDAFSNLTTGSVGAITINASTQITGILPVIHGGTGTNTSLTNNKIMISSGGLIVEGTSVISPSFTNVTASNSITTNSIIGGQLTLATSLGLPFLTSNAVLLTDINSNVIAGTINLATQISGILPIAHGGTNSGTTLTNNKIMISSGGQIIEGTSMINPVFNNLTVSSINVSSLSANSIILTDSFSNLTTGSVSLTTQVTGILPISNGGTNNFVPLLGGKFMVSTSGKISEGTSSTDPSFNSIFSSTSISGTSLSISGTASFTSLSASNLVATNSSSQLISVTTSSLIIDMSTQATGTLAISHGGTNSNTALSNGFIMISSAGKIIEGLSATSPSFTNITISNNTITSSLAVTTLAVSGTVSFSTYTPSLVLLTDASSNVIAGRVSLTTQITGILPIANGGTNSSTALTNGKLIISSGGALVEGTSSTSPTFTGSITSAGLTSSAAITISATNHQILLGTTNILTINSVAPVSSCQLNIPDPGVSGGNFILSSNIAQSILGVLNLTNSTNSTSITTGALILSGGLGVGQSLFANAITSTTSVSAVNINTTNVTSTGTGAFNTLGSTTLTVTGTVNLSTLSPSSIVFTDSSSNLITGQVDLTSQISGVLPIANGGTNSSTALTNGFIMISSGGKIIEGTSFTSPTFTGLVTSAGLNSSAAINISTITSNQLSFGTATKTTISVTIPAANHTITIPDPLGAANIILSAAIAQTLAGVTTFSNTTDATNTLTGAVIISGGVGVAKSLFANSIASTTTLSANTISSTTSITAGTTISAVGAQFSGLVASSVVLTDASKNLVSGTVNLTSQVNSILPIANGGTNSNTALTNNKIMISSGGQIIEGTSSTNPTFTTVTTTGSITAGTILNTVNANISSLTASSVVLTDSSKNLVSGTVNLSSQVNNILPIAHGGTNSSTALANGALMISSGGQIIEGTSSTNPTFNTVTIATDLDTNTITITSLTANSVVLSDALNNLVSGQVNLTSQVTGVLPIANGGTNSSTALANGKIMISSGGTIIEGTSSTSPSFTNVTASSTITANIVASNSLAVNNTILLSSLSASSVVLTDSSSNLVSGQVNLSTQVTNTLPIANGGTGAITAPLALASLGAVPLAGGTMTGSLILNADPTNPLGAVTKQYADAIASGNSVKQSCFAATTVDLGSVIYNNGASGSGATLTNNGAFAAFSVDGTSPSVSDRILVKNQTTTFQNGIYSVTTVGDAISVNWVLTRTSDFDSPVEAAAGATVIINMGTQEGNEYLQTATITTIGTDPILFSKFGNNGTVTLINLSSSNTTAISISGGPITTSGTIALTIGTELVGLAGLSSNGIITRTSAGTYTPITITGTTGFITVNNGNGVAGNPNITISSSYIGQTSITTLGTITSGTWNAGIIGIAYGGTNSSAALTNGKLMVSSGSAIIEGTSSSAPFFTTVTATSSMTTPSITVSSLTANSVVFTNGSKTLVSGTVNLTSQVNSILPIANGGTNSGTTLVGNKIMFSSSGAIIEGTSSISPTFTGLLTSAGLTSSSTLSISTTTNQIVLGGATTTTINAAAPASSTIITIPDPAATTANFIIDSNITQTLNGVTNFANTTNTSGLGTGAVIISGGLSVAQNTYIGGSLTIGSQANPVATISSNSTTGTATLIVQGSSVANTGYKIFQDGTTGNVSLQNLSTTGSLRFLSATGIPAIVVSNTGVITEMNPLDSTAPNNGSHIYSGGIGVVKTINCNALNATTNITSVNYTATGTIAANSLGSNSLAITGTANFSTLSVSSVVLTDSSSNLVSGTVNLTSQVNSILPIANGGTNSNTALTNGKIMISSGGAIIEGTSSSNPSFTTVTTSTSLTVGTILNTVNANISSLTASSVVLTDSSKNLVSGTVNLQTQVNSILPIANGGTNSSTALANGSLMISSGGKIIEGTSSSSPSFTNVTATNTITAATVNVTGLTASSIVLTDGSKNLISGTVNLSTQVNNVLPITNGGTNSSTPLSNGFIMVSSGGKIVEGTSLTTPSFTSLTTTGSITSGTSITATTTITTPAIKVSGLTASSVVLTDSSSNLISGQVSLTSQVSNVLPIGSGGTGANNAPSALTNLGAVPLAGGTMTGYLILNADPTNALGAVTKQYADAISNGLNIKTACYAATTVNLTATYNNGSSGVNATLTNSGTLAAFLVDGLNPPTGSRILVKNQTSTFQNGIYSVTTVGSGAVAWVLTRTPDYDVMSEIEIGNFIIVNNGTQATTGWVVTSVVNTIGTDPILFSQFGNQGTVTSINLSSNSSTALSISGAPITTSGTISLTVGTELIGLAGLSSNGIITRTSAGTYTASTINGTSNVITVTNGNGVSGNPTITIANTYVGQTSITTLGTIGTGVWNGTTIAIANGGTNSGTALTNGKIMISSGGAIVEGTSSTNPSFTTVTAVTSMNTPAINISGLTASSVVLTDASKNLISGTVTLTSQVNGILPIANGGTNSSTALTNGKLMISNGGAIVEGTSSSAPVFTGLVTSTGLTSSAAVSITLTTNQIILGTTNTLTISSIAPSVSRTLTIPDPASAGASFILSSNIAQSIAGITTFSNTTDSSSISTGAVIISGGLGVTKKIYCSSTLNIDEQANPTINLLSNSASAGTSTLLIQGSSTASTGFTIAQVGSTGNVTLTNASTGNISIVNGTTTLWSLSNSGIVSISNNTDSTSTSSGSVQLTGGLGVAKTLYANSIFSTTNVNAATLVASTSTTTPAITVSGLAINSVVLTNGTSGLTTGTVSLTSQINGILPIANGGTNSNTALTNGKFMISNGGQIIEGTSNTSPVFTGSISATSATLTNTTNQIVLGTTNTLTINSIAPSVSRTLIIPDPTINNASFVLTSLTQTLSGVITFSNTTSSSSVSTGAVIISGGLGVTKNIYCSAALNVDEQNNPIINVLSNVSSGGTASVLIQGSSTASTGLTIAQTGTSGNVTFTNASSGNFSFINGVTTLLSLSSAGIISISNATDSTNTSTGSVQLVGGMGIAKSLFANAITSTTSINAATLVASTSMTTPNITVSNLAINSVVLTNGSSGLTTGTVSLTSQVNGVLPIANGGTNSSTVLTNGNIMVSSAGKIVEGTSSSNPSFVSVTTTGSLTVGTTANIGSLTASSVVLTDGSKNLVSGTVSLTSQINGVLPIANGGTNANNAPQALTNLGALPTAGGTMTGFLILNADPTNALGAVTKQYADAISAGLYVKTACYAGTTANLNAVYSNGASGVGATLTNNGALAAFSVDGTAPPSGSRILVKNQTTTFQNGIYVLTTVGSGAVAWVLTRSSDYNIIADIQSGDFILLNNGTVQATTGWIETATVATIGTDAILFSQFGNQGTVTSINLSSNNTTALTISGGPITTNGTISLTVGTELVGLAGLSTTGLVTRTAAGTYTGSTILGTSNVITVTNGNGVSGNPTITIANTYVGQTSITTLGTIATGTWNGTTIAIANGGTNSTSALTNGKLMVSSGGAIVEGTSSSAPTFTGLVTSAGLTSSATINITPTTNQIILGTTNTLTINSTAPSASRVLTIPDPGANGNFIISTNIAQNIAGITTFSNTTDSTTVTSGGVIISGGLGVTKKIYCSSTLNVDEQANPTINILSNSAAAGVATLLVQGSSTASTGFTIAQTGSTGNVTLTNASSGSINFVGGSTTVLSITNSGLVGITNTTDASSTITGSVQLNGGIGIAKSLFANAISSVTSLTSASLSVTNTTNQIVLGTTNTLTISSTAPSASRVLTIPDPGANANFVLTANISQTIIGALSLSNGLTISASGASITGNTTINAGTVNIGTDAADNTINIGTSANLGRTLNIGNTVGISGIVKKVGIGNYSLDGVGASTYTIAASTTTGTVTIGGTAQTGTITLGSSSGTNILNIANGAGATTVNIANVQVAGSINLGAGMTTGSINIGGTGLQTGAINIGVGTGAQTISLGTGGTGIKTINIGTAAVANIISLGSTSSGNMGILCGSTLTIDGTISTIINMGASITTGTITIGGTAQTGTLTLGSSSGTNILNIANGSGATTVNIANVQVAGSVNIGAAMTTGTITIGGTGLQTGTIGIGVGTGAQTISLGTGGTGSKTINIGTGAIDNAITIGNNTGATSLSLKVGTGGYTLDGVGASTITAGASITTGTITIGGTAQTGTITLGSSSGTNILNLGTGTGATTINIGTGGSASNVVNIGSAGANNVVNGQTRHSATTNQIVFGTTNTTTINSVAPASSQIVTIPDVLANSTMILSTRGAVTQITSATTAVTLNAISGKITTVSQTVAVNATTSFTWNNSLLTASSLVMTTIQYTGTGNAKVSIAPAAGSATVTILNPDGTVGGAALNAVIAILFLIV